MIEVLSGIVNGGCEESCYIGGLQALILFMLWSIVFRPACTTSLGHHCRSGTSIQKHPSIQEYEKGCITIPY